MSSQSQSHLSSSSHSPTPSHTPFHPHPPPLPLHTTIIIITTVLISFFILLLAFSLFLLSRRRRQRHRDSLEASFSSCTRPRPTHSSTDLFSSDPDPFASTTNLTRPVSGYYHGTSITDPTHPAARITPFGSPGGETPQFKRTYSSPMRIAQRLPSGAWHFVDPRDPRSMSMSIPNTNTNTDLAIDGSSPRQRSRKEWEHTHARHAQNGSVRSSGSTWDKTRSRRSSDIGLAQPPPAYTPSRESVYVYVPVPAVVVKGEGDEGKVDEGVYEMKDVGKLKGGDAVHARVDDVTGCP